MALDSPAGQYNFKQGGNPALEPETSDTFSYGIVFTPGFAPGLSVSIDYFDIEVEDLISTFGAENTLDACYQFNDAARARASIAIRRTARCGSATATSMTSTSTSAACRPPAST